MHKRIEITHLYKVYNNRTKHRCVQNKSKINNKKWEKITKKKKNYTSCSKWLQNNPKDQRV